MKCRNLVRNSDGTYNIVWFGSYGKDENNKKLSAENYVSQSEAVQMSLIQRLAVIKNELWYNINYGLPLFDKIRNKAIMDAAIIKIINEHEAVRTLINYTSSVDQATHIYYFSALINTVYNENISLSSEYSL